MTHRWAFFPLGRRPRDDVRCRIGADTSRSRRVDGVKRPSKWPLCACAMSRSGLEAVGCLDQNRRGGNINVQ